MLHLAGAADDAGASGGFLQLDEHARLSRLCEQRLARGLREANVFATLRRACAIGHEPARALAMGFVVRHFRQFDASSFDQWCPPADDGLDWWTAQQEAALMREVVRALFSNARARTSRDGPPGARSPSRS